MAKKQLAFPDGRFSLADLEKANPLTKATTVHVWLAQAIADGKVAAVGADLDRAQAARVVDVGGHLVLPGLIDLHGHGFHRMGIGADPDAACLPYGTTTLVDGGSAGAATFDAFRTSWN